MRPEQLRTLRILWASIFGSTVTFLVVLLAVLAQAKAVSEPVPFLPAILGALALGSAAVSFVLPKHLFVLNVRAKQLKLVERSDQERRFDDSGRRPRVFAEPEQAVQAALPAYQSCMIVGLALGEATAMFGFVLGYLGSPLVLVLPCFALGWIVMLTKLPSEQGLVRRLEQIYDADFSGVHVKPGPTSRNN